MGDGAGSAGGLAVGLLGPVEVGRGSGPMASVPQPMLRVLLALLGVAAGRVITAEALVHELWAEDGSASRIRNLHSQISALRRRLEEVEPGRGKSRLLHTGGGYRLELDDGGLDAQLFQALTIRARRAARAGDVSQSTDVFGQALALWRGTAMADAAPWCQRLAAEAARLEEMRAEVIEEQLECDLDLGRPGEVAGRLAGLVGEFPLRERLVELLMLALWRCGRRGEALAVFDRARRTLATDLGLDPGPGLRDMHASVLADNPSLARSDAVGAVRAGPMFVPIPGAAAQPARRAAASTNLPTPAASFIGRAAELAELGDVLKRHRLVTLVGPGGAGKTRLAIEVAMAAAGDFIDGVWFADLADVTDPGAIAAAVAAAMGLRQASDQPVDQLLSTHVAVLNALLVVDNCEHLIDSAAATVERLAEAGADLHVIATSRQPLGLPGENVWLTPPIAFPPAQRLGQAAELAAFDAVRLFLDRAGQFGSGDVGADDLRIIAEITAAVDGLPLAIELAAARATQLDLRELASALRDRIGLSLLKSRTAHARQRTLETTIGWSYDLLTPELQAALKRLSVFSGSFTVAAADAVTKTQGMSSRWSPPWPSGL
jgi:DNA-binding SARP family transcriptional activator